MIAGLVLAAGDSTRFGAPKQLAELDGVPMLEHVLRVVAGAGLDRVVVVLGAAAGDVLDRVDLHGAEPIVCERWAEGQAASLACGLAELEDADQVVVVLGDQPRVCAEAISRVLAAGEGEAMVQATYGGRPGHPVLLSREVFGRLTGLAGDRGARAVVAGADIREVPCDDLGGGEDVDTPDQLEALRAVR